ncbi:probable LRR receptor-like serine/threonine-protein kinase At3g47570 [Oryza brachyantha]|uniref:non-specific serine/threonine protein kinase n=1 Tax=Oryza brachyantha TaxID=4533 RepID=J3L350_ORYBR|nr:probable LRR receptor-like serine/threonine-protein kinase At3g47570 [Oryza brachyantha]
MALFFHHLAGLVPTLLLLLLLANARGANADDLSALLAFRARVSDPRGVLRGNWTAATPYCGWAGVTCGHGRRHRLRVTALELPGVPLAGSLAPELGGLTFLSVLNLSDAQLSGPIPDGIGKNLPRLLSLDLSSNHLSGTIPSALGNLTVLEILDLDSNNLTGQIPPELHNLKNIVYLSLCSNELSGQIPHGLFNGTSQLLYLNLAHNKLTGSIPGAIGFLPKVEILALSWNQLSGPIPTSLFNMSSLEVMHLAMNNLSGLLPDNESFDLPMLQTVNLHKNQLAGTVPQGFGACKNLQIFILAYNGFTGGIPPWLASMTELMELSLGSTHLSGEIPAGLGNLTGLTHLDFTTSNLHGKIPPELGQLTRLQWLNLEKNNLTGTIPTSFRNLSMISMLDISFNSLTGHVPRSIFGQALTELYIDENKLTGDVDFMADLSGCKNLKNLVMNTNYFTGSIPGSVGNLSSLKIFRAFENQITGNIPNMLLRNQSNMLFMDLRNNRFTGEIPLSITEMKNLEMIDFSSNELVGTIPANIGKSNIFALGLAYNKLHGPIPDSISNLSRLQILELSNNQLTSEIPMGLWGLQNIVGLDLAGNALTGSLPEVGNVEAITFMNLSSNQFSGNLPTSLGLLSTLTYLDLSYNSFSGTIPKSFAKLSSVTTLNLSFNRLDGQIPKGGVFSNITLQSLRGNTALCGLPRLGFPHCEDDLRRRGKRSRLLKIVLIPSILASGIIAICLLFSIKLCTGKKLKDLPTNNDNNKHISYYELVRATNNFSSDHLIGAGSFGKVFRGNLDNEQIVAVKVLNMDMERATMSFDVECRALRMARHRNLVRILSTCSNLDFKALVLQYMPNGSLDEWLLYSDRHCLGLVQRVNIMLDVALAMAYLHHEHFEVVLHCDLKPSNVLLDADMTACVADFGIARLLLGDDTSIFSRSMPGTIGYMAPEYGSTGKASRKSDVFSYGIMLLEVLTGKKPTDAMFAGELSLREWVNRALPSRLADVVDPAISLHDETMSSSSGGLQDDSWTNGHEPAGDRSCIAQLLDLGLQCTRDLPEDRMTMKDVAAKLHRIKEVLQA